MSGYNFTDAVRKDLQSARSIAASLRHEYVGPEHILLALLDDPTCTAHVALKAMGTDLDQVAATVRDVARPGDHPSRNAPDLPYTSRAKKVLELSMLTARELGDDFVGTEHLLLGLIREEMSIAAQSLTACGVTLPQARDAVQQVRAAGETVEQWDTPRAGEEPAVAPRRSPRPDGPTAAGTGTLVIALLALTIALVALVRTF